MDDIRSIDTDRDGKTRLIIPKRMLTIRQLVALGYGSYDTLCRYVRTGELKAYRLGQRYLVRVSDAARLLEPVEPKPQPGKTTGEEEAR